MFKSGFHKLWETSISAQSLSSEHDPITSMKTGFQHTDFAAGHNKAQGFLFSIFHNYTTLTSNQDIFLDYEG